MASAVASAAYNMILKIGLNESICLIQMSLNKPVHFISIDAPVREIVNLATVASIDAAIYMKTGSCQVNEEKCQKTPKQ